MSSRLAIDDTGRLIVVGTGELRGMRWLVVDMFEIFVPRGRPPTARERAGVREPYRSTASPAWQLHEPENDQLDEAEAIRAAMVEQRRTPPDLVNVAA
jgi:hypothetical protein